jgi:L-aminopeptidase/D-esterase-like protein
MRWLEERGAGYRIAGGVVPIVPAAVVFDLAVGSFGARPDATSGYAACEAAGRDVREGAVGAGTGCTLAKWRGREHARKGGQGTASLRVAEHTVGALMAVNALGTVVDPQTGQSVESAPAPSAPDAARGESALNTTIGVVATDAPVSHGQLLRLAYMAHDGLAMAIRPAHTPFDGDTIFAFSTAPEESRIDNRLLMELGAATAQIVATSIVRAVRAAATGSP